MKVNREWINISDLMSGLMMVFLFIAIAFMIQTKDEEEALIKTQDAIKQIVMTYKRSQESLNIDLHKEFAKNLEDWGAEITKDNIFRFKSPDVLFDQGSSKISDKFKSILNDFFPRYIKLLTSKKYINEIDEIRVEGHTSDVWSNKSTRQETYLNNMQLSQSRANRVLNFCYKINDKHVRNHAHWLEKKLRANGMAFAKMLDTNDKSRRVEFEVMTKSQEKIVKIIETLN